MNVIRRGVVFPAGSSQTSIYECHDTRVPSVDDDIRDDIRDGHIAGTEQVVEAVEQHRKRWKWWSRWTLGRRRRRWSSTGNAGNGGAGGKGGDGLIVVISY